LHLLRKFGVLCFIVDIYTNFCFFCHCNSCRSKLLWYWYAKGNSFANHGKPATANTYSFLNEEIWHYGLSSITFKDGKVYEYDNFGNNLKVKAEIKTSSKSLIKIGSTKTDVIKSLGTPSSISKLSFLGVEVWYYGFSSITFKDNAVYSWNDFGDLKSHVSSINIYRGVEENINYAEIYPFTSK